MSTVAPREVTDISDQERKAIIEDLTSDAASEKPHAGKQESRTYVVLQRLPGSSPSQAQTWIFVQNVEATSTEQAIRKTVEGQKTSDEHTWVAIPARSFVPVSVSVKTTTQIILS